MKFVSKTSCIPMHLKPALYIFTFISCFHFELALPVSDSITTPQFLKDGETLISTNAYFQLGFFSPPNSRNNRYLGIWFNNKKNYDNTLEIIWVANRDNPVKDLSSRLKFSNEGSLQVIDDQNKTYWSSNVLSNKANSSVARLLNTGNLVLLRKGSDSVIWQSFDHPTNSLLPGVTLTFKKNIYDTSTKFQSWKSSTDPSSGRFRLVSLVRDLPEFFIVDGDNLYWRSGPCNGYLYVAMPYLNSEAAFGFNVANHNDTVDLSYESTDLSLFVCYVLTYDGILALKFWNASSSHNWENGWLSLQSQCDVYGKCGKFAVCNAKKEPICECVKGFDPENIDEWRKGNWTSGCIRRTVLQCRAPGSKEDKFLQMKDVKVPDYAHWIVASPDNCRRNCFRNCSCLAYSYYPGIGCMLWTGNLIDLQQYNVDGADLFLRLANSELPGESSKRKIIIIVAAILSAFVSTISVIYLWKWTGHGTEKRAKETQNEAEWQSMIGGAGSNDFQDLPLFEFSKLVTATDNFSQLNKLGIGGFGTVYKGTLEDGEEVAVKRLSKLSAQGLTEFMTEVLVISKLQHRNLVRLLGCCVDGEEKLLVYEYMPKKSLDALLFDQRHQDLRGWKKRFSIIQGICRGLLYLHRDSRLRIIHRDLKASNILLDDQLNPKISDFGMAKIFRESEDQADTNRVVGTYGYMSPEYAMDGRFSEKSDVFSFGVLLLEIVSGRRNNSFKEEESLSLLGHAWKLWNEDDIQSLIDPAALELDFLDDILRCIKVGLLCVQELPEDRPNICMIISMIDCEVLIVPHPTQPGFTQRRYATRSHQVLPHENVDASVSRISLSWITGR